MKVRRSEKGVVFLRIGGGSGGRGNNSYRTLILSEIKNKDPKLGSFLFENDFYGGEEGQLGHCFFRVTESVKFCNLVLIVNDLWS